MILGTILIFFAVLFVLILVHEWGHFIVAKKTGMRVDEFGIGFPPKIKGWKKGETEYSLNWLPIGGFVRIWGENYEDGVEGSKELSEADRSRRVQRTSKVGTSAGIGGRSNHERSFCLAATQYRLSHEWCDDPCGAGSG
jgi:RIP metalloprotease RseP